MTEPGEGPSRHDPEIAKRIGKFKAKQLLVPEMPNPLLSDIALDSLKSLEQLREELIAGGLDLKLRYKTPLQGALYNRALLLDRIAPLTIDFFTRAKTYLRFDTRLRRLRMAPIIILYNTRTNLLDDGLRTYSELRYFPNGDPDTNSYDLTPELVQQLWETKRDRGTIAMFGNQTPDQVIGKVERRIQKFTKR